MLVKWTKSIKGAILSLCGSKMPPSNSNIYASLISELELLSKVLSEEQGLFFPQIHLRLCCSKAEPCFWPQHSKNTQAV